MNDPLKDRARQTGPALESHYQFILWLVPTLERFPRSQKFLLGDRIQNIALNVLESLIEATYIRQRCQHLSQANLHRSLFCFSYGSHNSGHGTLSYRPPATGSKEGNMTRAIALVSLLIGNVNSVTAQHSTES